MPKIKGRVVKHINKDGKLYVVVALNGKPPKEGEYFSLKYGKLRSLPNNAFYWVFLQWILDSDKDLKDDFFSPLDFHEAIKVMFLSRVGKSGVMKVGSSTELTNNEFSELREKVNLWVTQERGIDTSEFWKQYEEGQAVA